MTGSEVSVENTFTEFGLALKNKSNNEMKLENSVIVELPLSVHHEEKNQKIASADCITHENISFWDRVKNGSVVGAPLCFCPEITTCFTAYCAATSPIILACIGLCVALIPLIAIVLTIVLPIVLTNNNSG